MMACISVPHYSPRNDASVLPGIREGTLKASSEEQSVARTYPTNLGHFLLLLKLGVIRKVKEQTGFKRQG